MAIQNFHFRTLVHIQVGNESFRSIAFPNRSAQRTLEQLRGERFKGPFSQPR